MLFVIINFSSRAQEVDEPSIIDIYLDKSIANGDESYFKEVHQLWKNYLESFQFLTRQNNFWNTDDQILPDYPYLQLCNYLKAARNRKQKIHCNILAIIPVENEYYMIKSMFVDRSDTTGQINLDFITTVYAKKNENSFLLFNSTEYHKELWTNQQVGAINYIIHPAHQFDLEMAKRMNEFNSEIAKEFGVPPIEFDYVAANNTIQLSKLIGFDFFEYSYMPIQSGGMADNYNRIIYAGNNSAYYPHEVVHLYIDARFRGQYHSWANEGVAAFWGGSTGYRIEWHWQKLKSFLQENPDYELKDLSALQTNIPNGEYMTDFRYAIGGYFCKKIYEKEGINGLFDALQAGKTEEDYFEMLHSKLGFERNDFGKYVKSEMMQLKKIDDSKLEQFRY